MTEDISRSETRVVGFEDPELDYQLLRQLGSANSGGVTVGEALRAAAPGVTRAVRRARRPARASGW